MNFFPRSLLARTALVILVTLIATQIVTAALFRHYFSQPRQQTAAIGFASHLKSISAALETIPPERHLEFIGRLQEKEGLRVVPVRDNEPVALAPDLPALRSVRERLKNQFGEQADLYFRPNSPHAVWVKLPMGEQAYWIVFPRNRIERDMPLAWIGWAAFGTLAALAGAYFVVRRLNRPLRALSQAAREIGHGKKPPPVDESGPDEIRAVASAFNQMSEDLAYQERERAAFLAGVSHDLRTPLARLRLNVEMLGGQTDNDMRTGMEQDIADMDSIIGQFLDFARQEDNEAPVEADLNQIVREACERFARGGASIQTELAALPPIRLRPVAMQRLLSNLLDNALNHGNHEVLVRTSTSVAGVALSVLDRGPGIPESETERLKQPFTRLDAARSGKTGAGLGLAIVDRIARLHGGTFDLLHRTGGGLEAHVLLPLDAKT